MIAAAVGSAGAAGFSRDQGLSVRSVLVLAAAALGLQTFLPTLLPVASLFNLPLLVAVYFMLTFRSAIPAMTVGMLVGWAHDGLMHGPVGTLGLVYAILGYLSSLASQLFKFSLFSVLGIFVGLAYLAHEVILYAIREYLLGQQAVFELGTWCALSALHAGVALLLYPLFDRLVGGK